jgi:hypothetical protein
VMAVPRWPFASQQRTGDLPIEQDGKPVGMTVSYSTIMYYPHHWHGVLWAVDEGQYYAAQKRGYLDLTLLRGAVLRLLFEAVKQERIDPPDNDDAINNAMDLAEAVLDAIDRAKVPSLAPFDGIEQIMRWAR